MLSNRGPQWTHATGNAESRPRSVAAKEAARASAQESGGRQRGWRRMMRAPSTAGVECRPLRSGGRRRLSSRLKQNKRRCGDLLGGARLDCPGMAVEWRICGACSAYATIAFFCRPSTPVGAGLTVRVRPRSAACDAKFYLEERNFRE